MDEDDLPYRHIWRIMSEFQLMGHDAIDPLAPRDLSRLTVLLVVARMSAPDWVDADGIRPPPRPARKGQVTAIADALDRPFETVRRHVKALESEGVCAVDRDGVALAVGTPRSEAIVDLLVATHDSFIRLIEALVAVRRPGGDRHTGTDDGPGPGDVLTRALDVRLSFYDRVVKPFDNWVLGALWGRISTANVRSIVLDPELSRRYAWTPTPDALRRPVSLNLIAHSLHLPYATVWRQARLLERDGLVSRNEDGWIVSNEHLANEKIAAGLIADARFIIRKLRELAALGMDLNRAGQRYIRSRPPLVELYPNSTVEGR